MPYYIKSGSSFIRRDCKGKFAKTKSINFADEYDSEWVAKRVIENCISPRERRECHIIFRKDTAKAPEKIIKRSTEESHNISVWEKELDKLGSFIESRGKRLQNLCDQLSDIDKEIVDVEHYIEINDLMDSEACAILAMLQSKLRSRRNIKNEIQIIKAIDDCNIDGTMFDSLRVVIDQIRNKTYTPRKLSELFDKKENDDVREDRTETG